MLGTVRPLSEMGTAPNVSSGFSYWHSGETSRTEPVIEVPPHLSYASSLQDVTKLKTSRRPVFVMNEKQSHDVFGIACDKNCACEGTDSKHFMTPLGPLQLTAEECNDILMKRAAAAASTSTGSQPIQIVQNVQITPPSEAGDIKPIIKRSASSNGMPKERPYACNECGKSFLLKHHLTTHARVHTGERPHACPHCGKAFAHKHCLNTHLLLHSSDRPYQCSECKKSFTLKHHLLTHTRVHSRERPFVCTECGRSFPLKRHLVTHQKFHAGERPFVCPVCGESFAQKEHLVMHARFHGSLTPFVCPDCGATFQRKFELVNHGRLHGRIPQSCPVCNKEFLQKRTLVAHIRLHNTDQPFTCLQCGEAFRTKLELTQHIKTTHSSEKPLVCSECGSCFNSREAMALHIRLHSGDKSFVTDLCVLTASLQTHATGQPSGVAQNSNVSQASNSNASSLNKPKPHICPHCGKAFAAKHGLLQHNKRHPEGACTLRTHVCETCNKAFFQKNHLLLHQRQHMESKPSAITSSAANHSPSGSMSQSAPVISQASIQQSQQQHQIQQHHQSVSSNSVNKKPLVCHECGSCFNNAEAMDLHIRLHTGDKTLITDVCLLTASLQNQENYHGHPTDLSGAKLIVKKTKNHICPHCSKAFAAKHGLLQHNKRHPDGTCNVKAFVCGTCNKAFYQKNHLLLHQRQHMEIKNSMSVPQINTSNIISQSTPVISQSGMAQMAMQQSNQMPNHY